MEHQNESGRETLEVFDSNLKSKGSVKEKISHSSSLKSDDLGGISQNITRQNSIFFQYCRTFFCSEPLDLIELVSRATKQKSESEIYGVPQEQ